MKKNNKIEKVVRVPFKYLISASLAGGIAKNALQPATFPRLLDIADGYDLYRITRLKFRGVRSVTTMASVQVTGYYPGIVDNNPTAYTDVSENLNSCTLAQSYQGKSEWCVVPSFDLRGMHEWYKTIAGTPESAEEIQGYLITFGSTTDAYAVEIVGLCEFAGPTNTGATPAIRAQLERKREKMRILSLLEDSSGDEGEDDPPPRKFTQHKFTAKQLASKKLEKQQPKTPGGP